MGNDIRGRLKRQRQRFAAKHPEIAKKYGKKSSRAYYLNYMHGMAAADYEALLRIQKGRCAICSRTPIEAGGKHLAVDHCHETGRVRGLLCDRCNLVLGLAREDSGRVDRFNEALQDGLRAYIVTRCVPAKRAGALC